MEENYLITIKGPMEQRGDTDTVELMTRGQFVQKGGSYYITYKETETTGYEGCTTTLKIAAKTAGWAPSCRSKKASATCAITRRASAL